MSDTENKASNGMSHRDLLTEVLGLLADIDGIMAPHRRRSGAAYRVDPLPPPPLPPTGPMGPDTTPRSVPRGSEAWRTENKIGPPQLTQATSPPNQPLSQVPKSHTQPSSADPFVAPPKVKPASVGPVPPPQKRKTPTSDATAPQPKRQSDGPAQAHPIKPDQTQTSDPVAQHTKLAQPETVQKNTVSATGREAPAPPTAKTADSVLPQRSLAPPQAEQPTTPLHSHDGAPRPKQVIPPNQPPQSQPQAFAQDPGAIQPRPAFGPPPSELPHRDSETETESIQTPEIVEIAAPAAKKPRRRQTADGAVHLTKAEARRLSKRLQRSFLERSLRRLT